MAVTVKINGTDITPYIAYGGLKWGYSDIDASGSGRTMDAVMHRGRVASKVRLDVTCKPLTTTEASLVLTLIEPEWVTVEYTDPMKNAVLTKTMYSNNRAAGYLLNRPESEDLWKLESFPLIEQ